MADYMTTYTGIDFAPLEPRKEDISIDDISHALSMMTRANGHLRDFFSVAQHCILCCDEAIARGYSNKVALACLLHDASEAYLADITRPVKKNIGRYLEIEKKLQDIVYDKYLGTFEFTDEEIKQIDSVDDTLLYQEFMYFMDKKLNLKNIKELKSAPSFEFEDFKKVENKYKKLFNELL
ncbi:MAG: phosphohydrolase [Sarcina sp.]